MRVALTTMCAKNATTAKRWAPFGPPNEFDFADANATLPVSRVLAMRGARGAGYQEGELGEYSEHCSWWS